jgi:hypothetical protein
MVGDLVLVDDDYQEVVDQEGTVVASDEFPKRPRKKAKKAAALAAKEAENSLKTANSTEGGDADSAEGKDANEKETDGTSKSNTDDNITKSADSAEDNTAGSSENKGEEEEEEVIQKDIDGSQAKAIESSMEENTGESTTEENPEGSKPCLLIDCNQKTPAVRAITEEDLPNIKIEDIVLPLPGHNVIYPNNVIKQWYEELLAVDGLSFTTMKQNVR